MLNSGEKNCTSCDKKNKYSNSCVVRKNISERNKKPKSDPPFKLNGQSLNGSCTIKTAQFKICGDMTCCHCLVFISKC